jgi:hypothetical protein
MSSFLKENYRKIILARNVKTYLFLMVEKIVWNLVKETPHPAPHST